jgi:hypothetical protein
MDEMMRELKGLMIVRMKEPLLLQMGLMFLYPLMRVP